MHTHPLTGEKQERGALFLPSLGGNGESPKTPESLAWLDREHGAPWQGYPLDGGGQRKSIFTGDKGHALRTHDKMK